MNIVKPAKMDVGRRAVKERTISLIGTALRNYITERLRPPYFGSMEPPQVEKALQDRRYAFNILSVYELEPRYDVAVMPGPNRYNTIPEVRINSIRVPDAHYAALIDAVNEEVVRRDTLRGLVDIEHAEQVAEYDEDIKFLLDFLKSVGVEVGDNYVEELTKK